MSKVVLYIATSLDGYIARKNDDFSWLYTEGDFGYDQFLETIGAIVMGRRTYDVILAMHGSWPYEMPTYVVTRQSGFQAATPNTRIHTGDLRELVEGIKRETDKDTWLEGGGLLNAGFFDLGLVDEVQLYVHPVLLGDGLPLAPGLQKDVWLDLQEIKRYERDLLGLTYRVRR